MRETKPELVETVFDVIKDALVGGEKVKFSGFGNFIVREKNARKGRNPHSRSIEVIPLRLLKATRAAARPSSMTSVTTSSTKPICPRNQPPERGSDARQPPDESGTGRLRSR